MAEAVLKVVGDFSDYDRGLSERQSGATAVVRGTFGAESPSGPGRGSPPAPLPFTPPFGYTFPPSAAGASPYPVGPAGWQNAAAPTPWQGFSPSPTPYAVAPTVGGAAAAYAPPPNSIPLFSLPVTAPPGPRPYALASTLPRWAQEAEDANFGGPDLDLNDVAALGSAAPGGGSPAAGGRRRRGGRAFGGLAGYYALHRIASAVSGYARSFERQQDIDFELETGQDPALDAQRAALATIQNQESRPGWETAGSLYDWFGTDRGPGSRRRVVRGNIQRIERGRAEAEFDTRLGAEVAESAGKAGRTLREAGLLGLTGTDRQRAAADARSADEAEAAARQRAELQAALNIAPDGIARQRAQAALDAFDANRPAVANAQVARRNAEQGAITRDEARRGWAIANRGGGAILRAQGRFGEADEEDFEAGLRQRVSDAARDDPGNLDATRADAANERLARAAGRAFRGERLAAQAAATNLRTAGDERGGILAEFADARRVANQRLVGEEREGALAQIQSRETAGLVSFADRRAEQMAALRDRQDVTGLMAQGREKSAHITDIERDALRGIMNLRGPDAAEQRSTILQTAVNELQANGRALQSRGLLGEGQAVPSGTSIGPGFQEQRPNEEDLAQAIRENTAAVQRLTDLQKGQDTFDGGGGGADF